MAVSNDDQRAVRGTEDVTAEDEAEWLAEQALIGGRILDEIRVSAAKRNMGLALTSRARHWNPMYA